jgi:signal transduction histidine kinase
VVVRTATINGSVEIQVEDDGCGIPERSLPSLFEPGFTSTHGRVEFGLGLPICYSIVESHHGNINVSSRVGVGTTFTVTLPTDGQKA